MPNFTLSILIPVYNFDIRPLVRDLQQQAAQLAMPVEILCFDDASESKFQGQNAAVSELPGVYYHLLPNNLGRARIRNLLAREAQHDYLLFLDCDSAVPDSSYLRTYADALAPDTLLYGGRVYQAEPPSDPALLLHWEYGRRREALSAEERQEQPYHSFMTNNFLIPRQLFQAIGFDERLRQYGHEDTLFGMELRQRAVPIKHLDNPLLHSGLEPAEAFLHKSQQALENLAFLHLQGSGIEARLLTWALRLRRSSGAQLLLGAWPLLEPALRRQLCSSWPQLRLFDLYKLGLLLRYLRGYQ